MNCTALLAQVERVIDGTLPSSERAAAIEHLAACPRCREIVAVLETDLGFLSREAPAGLAEAVLDRTSGRPCGRAREWLCALVDEDESVDGLDRELVEGHLATCADCAALQRALVGLRDDLPAFAELEPDPQFVARVTAATSVRRRPVRVAGGLGFVRGGWLDALLGRSRLAWEAGYVGALLLWLTFGASWAPLRAAPAQALAVVQENHVGAAVDAITSTLTARNVDGEGDDAWDRFWQRVSRTAAGGRQSP